MTAKSRHLLCFGLGYSAAEVVRRLDPALWSVAGTSTSPAGVAHLEAAGTRGYHFDGNSAPIALRQEIAASSHVLVSVPPGPRGDDVLRHFARDLAEAPNLEWIGYLSTIGVYGDHGGAWVTEDTPAHPEQERSRLRLEAEQGWLDAGRRTRARVQIFRLAGIYGPGRSPIDNVRAGTARRIVKPGQVFNRIHVEDIATAVLAGMAGRGTESVYNVTDDEPAPPEDVITFAAALLGVPPPPAVTWGQAGLSGMALSFYSENKRVRNSRLKSDLGIALAYPTYREGLRAVLAAGQV